MKTVVENLNPTRVRLNVEVPFEELKGSLDSAYRRIAQQVVVPGFRKGKVPPRVIDQRLGRGAVLEEAINDALPKLYGQAVQDNDLQPLGSPQVEVTELADGEELKFSAEVDVKPPVQLPAWEGLRVQVDDAEPTDEQVDAEIEALRARFGTLSGVERPAADGDYVVIDLVATAPGGEPIEDGSATGMSYQLGSGDLVEGLDEAVRGLSAGESATFTTRLRGGHEGDEARCTVTVSAVKEQELPALDDEFAQLASEFDTLDELRADIRQKRERANRIRQAVQARDQVLDLLLEAAGELPVPDGFVATQVSEHFKDGHGDAEHRAEFERDVRRRLAVQFVLDELVKAEELSVNQEELTDYILQRAVQAGMDPSELAQQLVSSNSLPAVVGDVVRGKALALVVERAEVVDASGRPVELDRLQDDGTLAPEGEVEEPVDAEALEQVEAAEQAEPEASKSGGGGA